MKIIFQGHTFIARPVEDTPHLFKVMYLNKTRNIAGACSDISAERLRRKLEMQSKACLRPHETSPDILVPRS